MQGASAHLLRCFRRFAEFSPLRMKNPIFNSRRAATIEYATKSLKKFSQGDTHLIDPSLFFTAVGSSASKEVDLSTQGVSQRALGARDLYQDPDAAIDQLLSENHGATVTGASVTQLSMRKEPAQLYPYAVMDFSSSRMSVEAIHEHFRKLFPKFRLRIDHSEGKDVQGKKTHTISLYLVHPMPRGGALSDQEAFALSKFKGESIGMSYFGTLKRALRQACAAAGLAQPHDGPSKENLSSTSLLSLHLDVLHDRCAALKITFSDEGEEEVKIVIQNGEELLASTRGSRQFALSLLLAAAEAAAIKRDDAATSKVAQHIQNAPIVVVLPEKNVNVKKVLRHLMNYYYGIPEDHIHFEVQVMTGSLFRCSVVVQLPAALCTRVGSSALNPTQPTSQQKFVLGVCIASGKKLSEKLASVEVLQNHFSRVFQDQLEFHAEIRDLMEQAKHMRVTNATPHHSAGLSQLLDWALQQEGRKRFELKTCCLKPNTTYKSIGVHARFMCWRTCLSFLSDQESELVAVAYDVKKKRSEQMAIASALAKRFGKVCVEAVAHAQSQNLIDADGDPIPCESVDFNLPPTEDGDRSEESQCGEPFWEAIKFLPVQDLMDPFSDSEPSLLSMFRQLRTAYEEHLNKASTAGASMSNTGQGTLLLQEEVQWDSVTGLWTASLYVVPSPPLHGSNTDADAGPVSLKDSTMSTHISVAAFISPIKVAAILQMYQLWLERMSEQRSDDVVTTFLKSPNVQDIIGSIRATTNTLPRVWNDKKNIEAVLDAIRRLYAVGIQLRIRKYPTYASVEVWGRTRESDGLENEDETPTVCHTSEGAENAARDEPPLVAGRYVFLSEARAFAPEKGILQCCQHIHATHISPFLPVFAVSKPSNAKFELTISPHSRLRALMDAVIGEIEHSSSEKSPCSGKLTFHYDEFSNKPFQVDFSVVCKEREVVMETVQASDAVLALQQLSKNIYQEIGSRLDRTESGASFPPNALLSQKLEILCKKSLGLPVKFETALQKNVWHCRIGLELDSQHGYCLAVTNSTRKKEALNEAASSVLKAYFTQDEEGNSTNSSSPHSIQNNYVYLFDRNRPVKE